MRARHLAIATALLLACTAAAQAEGPQGAATPQVAAPGAPNDAKPQPTPPAPGDADAQLVKRCDDEIAALGKEVGSPSEAQAGADHDQRIRATVKLYVATELEKSKNGRACLQRTAEAHEIMQSAAPDAGSSGSSEPPK